MIIRLLTSGLFAGAAAGLIAGLLQLWLVQPVLLHAELYETGELVHFGAASSVPAAQEVGGIDPVRDGLSVVFTMFTYTGFALVLVALMSVAEGRGARIDARTGLLWGLAGFIAVQLAPAVGLAPGVPGVSAADIALRQVWWFSTVLASAMAIWLIAFGGSRVAGAVAVVLLLAPHVIGAPRPEVFTGPAPTEIGALFAARSLGIGMAAWVLVGLFAGYFWSRRTGTDQPEPMA